MNQSPAPVALVSRTHKTYSAITRLLLWMVLAVWLLFALTWGALHLWIVPRIGEWRPDLERWASAAVGVPVTVGDLRADTAGDTQGTTGFLFRLVPALELSDVRLFDPAGREALLLPRVRAAVSVTSLWRLGFEQLLIDRPVLDVRRTSQGQIEIAGLDFSSPQDPDSRAADWFFSQTEFVIQQGTVRWTDDLRNQPPLALSGLSFVSRNSVRSHLLRLDATPPSEWGATVQPDGQPARAAAGPGTAWRPAGRRPGTTGAGRVARLYADLSPTSMCRAAWRLPRPVALGRRGAHRQGHLRAWAM